MVILWLRAGALGPVAGSCDIPPLLLGEHGGHTSVKPALPNEDPVLIQGPLPQNRRYPCRKLPAPLQVAPFARESAVCRANLLVCFSPLVGMVRPCVDGVPEAISGLGAAPPW